MQSGNIGSIDQNSPRSVLELFADDPRLSTVDLPFDLLLVQREVVRKFRRGRMLICRPVHQTSIQDFPQRLWQGRTRLWCSGCVYPGLVPLLDGTIGQDLAGRRVGGDIDAILVHFVTLSDR